MPDKKPSAAKTAHATADDAFMRHVAIKANRKRKAQAAGNTGVWFGLGMAGMIGWSVALPTVFGALLGLWLDGHHRAMHSWTLTLLAAGLVMGCANAWHWVSQQNHSIKNELDDDE